MRQVLLYGARSKARIAQAMCEEAGHTVAFVFDPELDAPAFATSARFGNRPAELARFARAATDVVVAIGGEHGEARCAVARALADGFGLSALALVHAAALIDAGCEIGPGLHAMPGAVVHKFCRLGAHCIANTNCTIDHECRLGDGVHVMGGACLAGRVTVEDFATVGTNATVLPDVRIGKGAFVGAGAVVREDVAPYDVVCGVPARRLRARSPLVDLAVIEAARELA